MDNNISTETSATITLGEWLLTTLILAIPCVGLIMTFVWAFGDTKNTKPSKSNYAKAVLIWYAISIVISIISWSAMAATISNIISSFQ